MKPEAFAKEAFAKEAFAKYFDHTILNPAATQNEIKQVCNEALEYGFFSVCVNPVHVRLANEQLISVNEQSTTVNEQPTTSNIKAYSIVKVCSVIGFPLGAHTSAIKAQETSEAIKNGADEIDMVINIGALIDCDFETVESDIKAVVKAAGGKTVKVIIETCLLDQQQKIKACQLARNAGARFVKTSTGFAGGGATFEDVALMKQTVGDQLKVKASGGIKTVEDALKMIEAGADRIGASAGVAIMKAFAS